MCRVDFKTLFVALIFSISIAEAQISPATQCVEESDAEKVLSYNPTDEMKVDHYLHLINGSDSTARRDAFEALQQMRIRAFRPLVARLNHPDEELRTSAALAMLISVIPNSGEASFDEISDEVLEVFKKLAREKSLETHRIGQAGLGNLAQSRIPRIREQAMNSILTILENESPEGNYMTLFSAMGELGDKTGHRGLKVTLKYLNHSDIQVRGYAINALGPVGKNSSVAIKILTDTLSDKDLMHNALASLKHTGKNAAPALPKLLEMANDPKQSESTRTDIFEIIGGLEELGEPAIPTLLRTLNNEKAFMKAEFKSNLGNFIAQDVENAAIALTRIVKSEPKALKLAGVNITGKPFSHRDLILSEIIMPGFRLAREDTEVVILRTRKALEHAVMENPQADSLFELVALRLPLMTDEEQKSAYESEGLSKLKDSLDL